MLTFVNCGYAFVSWEALIVLEPGFPRVDEGGKRSG
jgi:hypothetical protein